MKTGLGGELFYKFPDELSPVGGYVWVYSEGELTVMTFCAAKTCHPSTDWEVSVLIVPSS